MKGSIAMIEHVAQHLGELSREVVFLATKLEAFGQRGNSDPIGSRDIEDIISVVDGRPELLDQLPAAAPPVRPFIREALTPLEATMAFRNAVLGYLPHSPKGQQRYVSIIQRFESITQMDS